MYLCVGTECEWILYFNCREGKGYCKIKVLVRFETRARIIDTEHLNVILKFGASLRRPSASARASLQTSQFATRRTR